MSLKPYPVYKDSSVAWLGDVPAHWRVSPLKYLATLKSGGTPSKDNLEFWNGDIPWASAKDLKTERLADTIDHLTEAAFEKGGASLVRAGSVLVVVRGMILAKMFPVTETLVPMAINQDLKALEPSDFIHATYLSWLLRGSADESLRLLDEAGHGTKALRMETWRAMILPVPPATEQIKIVHFIETELVRIDDLIAEQEKLIELLSEKRQATISHAVTKGLNSSAPMKDSGVEWLGEIPAHWEIQRLGSLASQIQTGPFGSQLHSEDYVDNELPVINPSNIRDGKIIPDWSNTITPARADDLLQHQLKLGDIIFARRGEMGRCAMVDVENEGWICGTGCLNVRLASAFPKFVSIFLGTPFVKELLQLTSVGSTMDNLNTEILSNVPVAIPTNIQEQKDVIRFLNLELAKLDNLNFEANRVIELLKERRTALISAAVTGKIDVRNAVAEQVAA